MTDIPPRTSWDVYEVAVSIGDGPVALSLRLSPEAVEAARVAGGSLAALPPGSVEVSLSSEALRPGAPASRGATLSALPTSLRRWACTHAGSGVAGVSPGASAAQAAAAYARGDVESGDPGEERDVADVLVRDARTGAVALCRVAEEEIVRWDEVPAGCALDDALGPRPAPSAGDAAALLAAEETARAGRG